jgi:hypothetical protein
LLQEGDPAPDGFEVQFQNEILVGGGSWIVSINTTNPDTSVDDYLIRDGAVLVAPGDPMPGAAGETIDFFRDADHFGPAFSAYSARGSSSGDDFIVVGDGFVAREDGAVDGGLGLPAGTVWSRLELVQVPSASKVAVPGSVQIPSAPGDTGVIAVFDVDGSGQVVGASLPVQQGMALSDGRAVDFIFAGNNETRVNALGEALWWGFTSTSEAIIAIDDVVVAEGNQATPDPSLTWRPFAGPEVDLNDEGDWVIKALVTSFPRDVIMTSSGLVARQGSAHPAFPSFTVGDFGLNSPVFVDNSGTVAFYVDLSGTSSTADDEAIVVGDQIVAREGVTQVGGGTIVGIDDGSRGFHYARDGSSLIFEGDLDLGGQIRETNFLVTFGPGQSYCIAELNSTGVAASIAATGSAEVAANDLSVVATDLPLNAFSFFLVSETQGFTAMPGGSQGNICLGGSIGRYQLFASSSGNTGSIALDIDLTDVPAPSGSFAAAPGTTLNFQAWYRDANPMATSNFTDGVAVTCK